MYAVTVRFVVAPEHAATFAHHMTENAARSLQEEAGCLRFDVCHNDGAEHIVFLYELYDDRAAFDAHLATAHFKSFDAAVAPMIVSKDVATFDRVFP